MEGSFTQALLSALLLYKYAGLFALEYVSALGVPLPSAAALVASGVFARQGYFSLSTILAIGFFGNIFGDISLFYLARHFKAKILRLLRIKESGNTGMIGSIESMLYSHSGTAVTISRLSGSGSPAVSALAGISELEAKKFIPYAILGEIIYAALYVLIGYFFAVEWEDIPSFALPAILIAIIAILIIVATRNKSRG